MIVMRLTKYIATIASEYVSVAMILVASMIRGIQSMTVKHGANHVQITPPIGVITVKNTRQAQTIM
jgi:hypothetical protein